MSNLKKSFAKFAISNLTVIKGGIWKCTGTTHDGGMTNESYSEYDTAGRWTGNSRVDSCRD